MHDSSDIETNAAMVVTNATDTVRQRTFRKLKIQLLEEREQSGTMQSGDAEMLGMLRSLEKFAGEDQIVAVRDDHGFRVHCLTAEHAAHLLAFGAAQGVACRLATAEEAFRYRVNAQCRLARAL